MQRIQAATIDDYLAVFAEPVKSRLVKMRETIRKAAPQAEEKMTYAIPTFFLNGNLVHFAGYEKHIGFYPGPAGIEEFKKELKEYTTSKGTVQFPHDKPLPLRLVATMVKFRVHQNLEKKKVKSKPAKKKGR